MSYNDFVDTIMKLSKKREDDKIFRLMAAVKSLNNG